jgi:hypothetical protein
MARNRGGKASRGRRILLWTAGLFLLGQAAAGVVADRFLWKERSPMLFQHLARVQALPQPPGVVCLGSSRLGCALDDEAATRTLQQEAGDGAPRVYNASLPAGDYLASEVTLHELLCRGWKPRSLVLEICPELVNARNEWIKFYISRGLTWKDVPAFLVEATRTDNLGRLLHARLLPVSFYRDAYQTRLAGLARRAVQDALATREPAGQAPVPPIDWLGILRQGLANPNVRTGDLTQTGLHAARRGLRDFHPGGNSVAALERLLGVCRAEGIAVVLLAPPMTAARRDLYTPAIEASFRTFLEGVIQTYGCRFVDCRDWLPDADFFDDHHATPEGCSRFSRRLCEQVLAPMWRTGQPGCTAPRK